MKDVHNCHRTLGQHLTISLCPLQLNKSGVFSVSVFAKSLVGTVMDFGIVSVDGIRYIGSTVLYCMVYKFPGIFAVSGIRFFSPAIRDLVFGIWQILRYPCPMYDLQFEGKMPQCAMQLLELAIITASSSVVRVGCIFMTHNCRKKKISNKKKNQINFLKHTEKPCPE